MVKEIMLGRIYDSNLELIGGEVGNIIILLPAYIYVFDVRADGGSCPAHSVSEISSRQIDKKRVRVEQSEVGTPCLFSERKLNIECWARVRS